MYSIEKANYGYTLVLSGILSEMDLEALHTELLVLLRESPIKYQLLLKANQLEPLGIDAKRVYEKVLRVFISTGLNRSCLLYTSPSINLQLRNIAMRIPYNGERSINIAKTINYKRISQEWLIYGNEFSNIQESNASHL